jgi:D-threo-aldose 1-dehydrogenase
VSYDPLERVHVGRTDVRITRLGFGTAEIGGLYRPVSDDAAAAMLDHAWGLGIRYFDTAPLYGYGNAERRLGLALAGRPRGDFVVSTKVGRRLYPRDALPASADIDRQAFDGREDAFYAGTPPVRPVFDYSADGVRRSLDESLERLGLDRVDIVYIHDPDDHWEQAIDGAYPALRGLRQQGVVGAIGVGIKQWQLLVRFAYEGDFDVFMVAGRYTLLDRSALPELLPLCLEKGISVVVVGVMNTGLLADPRPASTFDYTPVRPEMLQRALRLKEACERHGVPLKAAAIQFPLAHPAVTGIVAGVRSPAHLDDYPAAMRRSIPAELWRGLRESGLLDADAPTPPVDTPTPPGDGPTPPG